MAFEAKYMNYGVVKADNGIAKVYYGPNDYRSISMCGHIVEARWAGDGIIVKRAEDSNCVFRWSDFDHYETIYTDR